MSRTQILVSIIIPVYRDTERLRCCLEALSRQTFPAANYEVIVVNNDPGRPLSNVAAAYPRFRFSDESAVGSYAARNAGVTLARGDIFAFTDADCIPSPHWIAHGIRRITEQNNAGFVAGRIVLRYRHGEPRNAAEWIDTLFGWPQERCLDLHFGMTANLWTRRAVLDDVGAFQSGLKSGGDMEWGQRVFGKGYTQRLASDVQVEHPAIDTVSGFIRKMRRITGGLADLSAGNGRPAALNLANTLRADLSDYGRYADRLASLERPGRWMRIQLFFLVTLLMSVRMGERVRLCCGGRSRRA